MHYIDSQVWSALKSWFLSREHALEPSEWFAHCRNLNPTALQRGSEIKSTVIITKVKQHYKYPVNS